MSDIDSKISVMEVRVYSSNKSTFGFLQILRKIWKELPAAHSLGYIFAKRNIQAKYRQSVFGILVRELAAKRQ